MDFRIKQSFLNNFHVIFIQECVTVHILMFTDPSLHHKVWIFEGFSSADDLFSLQQEPTHIQSDSYARPARERSFHSTRVHRCARDGFGPTAFKQQWPLSGEWLQIPASAAWIEYNTWTFRIKLLRYCTQHSVLCQKLPEDTFFFFFFLSSPGATFCPITAQSGPD